MKIAFLMGVACSLMLTAVGWLWHQVFLGVVVGVSLITAFLVSTSMATVMPIMLKRMGVDPAVAAGPFVTTANDITGIAIYLTLATIFLEQLR
ncbi:MAG: magnesium transporter [Nitrospiraceae bacterium]